MPASSDQPSQAVRTTQHPIKTPIGTHDLLPPDSDRWIVLTNLFAQVASCYGFSLLNTPVFEQAAVFDQVGGGTDVVGKEMYRFADRSDREMALRPEGTAAVCRAFSQHRPTTPWKVWYQGPFFRYEAPQAGRFRQFHQFGAETLGTVDPDADVEIIALASELLTGVGLRKVSLVINSLGDKDTRATYSAALGEYLQANLKNLNEADHEKAASHPLRVLDSKHPESIEATDNAPKIEQFLSPAAAEHFNRVRAGLDAIGIKYQTDHRLVRGLDYYTNTTFEFRSRSLDSAQDTVCGGGSYNGLVEALGGPPTPGVGFGLGIERLLLTCDAEGVFQIPAIGPKVWVIDVTDGSVARDLTQQLRTAGISSDRSFDGRSMRAQMRSADRAGAQVAIIIGDDELASGAYTMRWLRAPFPEPLSDEQREMPVQVDALIATLREMFVKAELASAQAIQDRRNRD